MIVCLQSSLPLTRKERRSGTSRCCHIQFLQVLSSAINMWARTLLGNQLKAMHILRGVHWEDKRRGEAAENVILTRGGGSVIPAILTACSLTRQTSLTGCGWFNNYFTARVTIILKHISRSVPTNRSTYQDHSYFSCLQSISAPIIISHHPYKPVADPVRLQPWNNFLSFLYFGAKRKIEKKQILNSASNPDKL